MSNDLVFTEQRNVSLRRTTVMVARLIFYRLLGVENQILKLEKRVKSLEDTLYNFQNGQEELLEEFKNGKTQKQA